MLQNLLSAAVLIGALRCTQWPVPYLLHQYVRKSSLEYKGLNTCAHAEFTTGRLVTFPINVSCAILSCSIAKAFLYIKLSLLKNTWLKNFTIWLINGQSTRQRSSFSLLTHTFSGYMRGSRNF